MDNQHKIPDSPEHGLTTVSAAIVIIISLVAGVVGGMYGALDLAKRPVFQRWFGSGAINSNYSQNLVVNEESAITDMVKKTGPAVASIIISKDLSKITNPFDGFGFFGNQQRQQQGLQQVGAGTGFFVSSDGLMITNKHVVSDAAASYSVITNDGKTYNAKVLSLDPVNDLAVIKVEISNAPYLEFADSSKLELGQHVVAIGNSLGQYQNTVTSGIISGVGRSIVAGGGGTSEQLEGVIQTDAAINPGNSGGPLLDFSGRVVGINTAVDQEGQSVGFAIPANDVKVALESFQKNGKITRPFVGVRYVMINKTIAEGRKLEKDYGALILSGDINEPAIVSGSPAEKAGLKEGDIILEAANQKLTEDNTLVKVLRGFKVGDNLQLKVWRGGKEINVNLTLGESK